MPAAKKRSKSTTSKTPSSAKRTPKGKELMIVESPTKARTIGRIVGERFDVLSSMGHIRDLPKSGMSVDTEKGFEPSYEIPPAKKKTVAALRKAAKESASVWLATDEDREGEAIAWHLAQALKLPVSRTRRIVFHEITKSAILDAIKAPRAVDQALVDAQQARRVLDRLVGYELSPVLWRKVMTGLSAGRVQSVAVRLVVEREREIGGFTPVVSYRVTGDFDAGKGAVFAARLDTDFETEGQARSFLQRLIGAGFTVDGLEKKPGRKSPRPPFTTSTLQQEASQRLGFSVKRTMALAQRLYEAGKITYMRTDSVVMSGVALAQARRVVAAQYGKEYARTRQYKTKSKGAQEAHEAIRPTDFTLSELAGESAESKLYGLIWRRALASQMADARVERTTVTVAPSTVSERFKAKGEVVLFDGFLRLYASADEDEEEDGRLPPLVQGQEVLLVEAVARQTFSRPPTRYTEASLVKKLEELGIGRPSTYAPTVSTIQDRGYVEKRGMPAEDRSYRVLVLKGGGVSEEERSEKAGGEKAKLFPTDVAGVVTDFLVTHFTEVIDYGFTAKVEEELDQIAQGGKEWRAMMAEFYAPFHADIEKVHELPREQVSGARELGTDPKTGKPVSARVGRFGPYVQIGTKDDEEKPRFAGLRPGQKLETITLEEALELFKLPRKLGKTRDGEDVSANYGRFGPYVKFGTKYVSIKGLDPLEITLEQALALIAEKKKLDAKNEIKGFEGTDIRVLRGRYGPYVTDGKKNAKIPKGEDPAELTLEQCRKLLAEAPDRPRRGRKKK
jgi:DNA topoisomerase-1